MTSLFAFFGAPGEMWIILVIALLLFGNRLPGVMRSLGKGVTEFKKGIEGVEEDVDAAVKKSETKKVDEQPAKT
jgi:sec-independent protein translocase protein TatA